MKPMIMLGIDPGCIVSGFSIIKKESQTLFLCDYGYFSMTSAKPLQERIFLLYNFYQQKIIEWKVTDIALETPFLGKNAQNFLKLGYVRGIIYLLAQQHAITLHEFAPREIKQAVTGYGSASKEQVERVIQQLFPRLPEQKKADVTDAIATGLCGVWLQKRAIVY